MPRNVATRPAGDRRLPRRLRLPALFRAPNAFPAISCVTARAATASPTTASRARAGTAASRCTGERDRLGLPRLRIDLRFSRDDAEASRARTALARWLARLRLRTARISRSPKRRTPRRSSLDVAWHASDSALRAWAHAARGRGRCAISRRFDCPNLYVLGFRRVSDFGSGQSDAFDRRARRAAGRRRSPPKPRAGVIVERGRARMVDDLPISAS